MEEKSFEPTPRKLKKAYEEGERPFSLLLAQSVAFLTGLILLFAMSGRLLNALKKALTMGFSLSPVSSLAETSFKVLWPLFLPMLILMIALMLFAWGSHLMQLGWIWKWKKRGKGKNYYGYSFLLAVAKLGIISSVGALFLFTRKTFNASVLFDDGFMLAFLVALAIFLLGLFDYMMQKRRFREERKMTQQELDEERRESQVRARNKKEN